METPIKTETTNNDAVIPSSIYESPKKLSFSFNFDLESVVSDESSDSEGPNLQIDVAEIDNYERPKKRTRIEIDETRALNEMEEEIERQLDAKAAKTNLTAINVKNILKHVITNEHVLAMVQNSIHNTEDGTVFEPKLTRAKAKELAMTQTNMPWPITPLKKVPPSKVQELIEKDLSEDSSDEEYSPEQDKESDDDNETDVLINSDIDSQPSTPATPNGAPNEKSEEEIPTDIHYDPDGIFKLPGIPHVPTEEESIGQRTRSKLCLSETPLELIEQAFIPPDITTDMYDWDCDIDEDWDNFLKEFTKPLGHDAAIEDDTEADPEYNILEDKETDLLDKEELRMDKAVKVTRKELNNLVAELFEFDDMFENDVDEQPKKKKSPETSMIPLSNNSMNRDIVDPLPTLVEPELPKLVSSDQLHLLATQLRQHVQLVTQHFAMTYMHPKLSSHAQICKDNLGSLSYLKDGWNCAFHVENMSDALKFISDWEMEFEDEKFQSEYHDFMSEQVRMEVAYSKKGRKFVQAFHPTLVKLIVESKALMYPQLLPHTLFRTSLLNATRGQYLNCEEFLIALGLEQFLPFVEARKSRFNNKKMNLMDAAHLITKYILPCRPPTAMVKHIQAVRASNRLNPIKTFFTTGAAPRTIHCITLNVELVAPKDRHPDLLPRIWRDYVRDYLLNSRKKKRSKDNRLAKTNPELSKPSIDMVVGRHLRSPIVNMLPSVSYQRISPKAIDPLVDGTNVGVVEEDLSPTSPQLRKTTPRLAKIRSAQNMKLMTQVSATKPISSCSRMKSRAKSESSKDSEESCGSTKGDNEDEIAELMLASTTIKKDTANRKKAKQARDLENIKRLHEGESELAKEERATKFAASYLQKLQATLESTNPETLKASMKLYLEYNEKLEGIKESDVKETSSENRREESSVLSKEGQENAGEAKDFPVFNFYRDVCSEKLEEIKESDVKETNSENRIDESSAQTKERQEKGREAKDFLAINFYRDVCNTLRDYPELCTDFLLFLNPRQAAMLDKTGEHMMLEKMNHFMHVAIIYFAKQPSRMAKIMKGITQLASDRYVTLVDVHTIMDPIMKGHPLVMDLLLQSLPSAKPPDSLFAMNLFENITCPMGPYDKHKTYTEDSAELYENIELPLPTSQDDPYGGDNCKCDCHESRESDSKTGTEHCVSCGTRFLNGRIYLQTPEGLRPAKITFPGNDEEKLENIARVSVKTTERYVPVAPPNRRRKSSKNEPGSEDSSHKVCSSKASPTKDSDDGEKSTSKSRRGAKSPPKTGEQRKLSKINEISAIAGTSATSGICEPTSPLKSKRETRAERREAKLESKNTSQVGVDVNRITGEMSPGMSSEQSDELTVRTSNCALNSSDSDGYVDGSSSTINPEFDVDMNSDDYEEPWARNEDMILLQNIKQDYSESTFDAVSQLLGNRTLQQVKERFQTLLSMLEKMS